MTVAEHWRGVDCGCRCARAAAQAKYEDPGSLEHSPRISEPGHRERQCSFNRPVINFYNSWEYNILRTPFGAICPEDSRRPKLRYWIQAYTSLSGRIKIFPETALLGSALAVIRTLRIELLRKRANVTFGMPTLSQQHK